MQRASDDAQDFARAVALVDAQRAAAAGVDQHRHHARQQRAGIAGIVDAHGDIDVAVYSQAAIDAAQSAAASAGRVAALHLKVDTGMHRVGCAPGDAIGLAHAVHESPRSRLAGLFTHFATADDPASMYPAIQLERYRQVDDALADAGIGGYLRHAANSAGAIAVAGAPSKVRRNMPDPIPMMVIGRLAIDQRWHGRGIGRALLREAPGNPSALLLTLGDARAALAPDQE